MQNLNLIDYLVIGFYFAVLVGLGFYLQKRASASLEDYFLGGRKLPWWALGVSGMASFLDITGTVLIVSFLFMLGPRGLFIEFRGGAVLVLVIYLLWTGKWHRRSGCMTGAEWMVYRFGEGVGGQAARIACAVSEVVFTIGMLTYMAKGLGIFLTTFLPFSPFVCSLVMIGIAMIYTMMSGFYGVVYTDIFQSFIILIAVVSISLMATFKVEDAQSLSTMAYQVTGTKQWLSSLPSFHTSMPRGYETYQYLFMFAMFYLFRNIFYGMATGADPKYFGAKNDRECGKLTFMWTWLMMFRWPIMIGVAVLGLILVQREFPEQKVLDQAAQQVKIYYMQQAYPDNPQAVANGELVKKVIPKPLWGEKISAIVNKPGQHPEIAARLQKILGEKNWRLKLQMVSYEGTVNPEKILSSVLLFDIPLGLRGMLLIALIAASMSTYDSTVNRGAGFFTRDLYQRYIHRGASNRELIFATWMFIIFVSGAGLFMGNFVENINDIWDWIAMGLGGGLLVPQFLRFYWWRFNGGGFAIGTFIGLVGALTQRALYPDMDPRWQFLYLLGIGMAGSIFGTYITKPTDAQILKHFYRTTRPFGFWGWLKDTVSPSVRASMVREHRNDWLAMPFTLIWQVTLFLLPMQLIIHTYRAFAVTLVIFLLCLLGMYIFWYRNLPAANIEMEDNKPTGNNIPQRPDS